MTSALRSPLLLATLACALAACAVAACAKNAGPEENPRAADAASAQKAAVRVTNRNFYDMNLFVVRFGQRQRLGTVTGNATRTFELPSTWVTNGPVRFLAVPIGGNGPEFTEDLNVRPGDIIGLTIQP
jgi:hypothetical protein